MTLLQRLPLLALSALTGAFLAALPDAGAQGFPNKPVRIISVYPTGISPDIATRVVADKLSRAWNQPVVVESRPGANGFIAINAARQAPADGYTLLLVGNAHMAINPYLFKSVPYDVETDFAPISTLYRAPFFLVVSATGPFKTVQDLIAAARAKPEQVTYSTPYVGSPPHLGGAALAHLTDTKMLAVHYKEGAQLYTSIANGDISFSIGTIGSITPLVKAGKLKILAIAAQLRLAIEPNVPTIEEAGGPKGLVVESWIGLVAMRGTPPEIVRRISEDMEKVMAEPEVKERLRNDGMVATAITRGDLSQLIRSDGKAYSELIKRIGLKAE